MNLIFTLFFYNELKEAHEDYSHNKDHETNEIYDVRISDFFLKKFFSVFGF
jgi:hypothetical protein